MIAMTALHGSGFEDRFVGDKIAGHFFGYHLVDPFNSSLV